MRTFVRSCGGPLGAQAVDMPRLRKAACFFLVVSALGCRTPQRGEITDNKDVSPRGALPAGELSTDKIENKDALSGGSPSAGSPPAGTAPIDKVEPSAVASQTPAHVGSVQTIRETTGRLLGRPKESKAIIPFNLSASDLGLAKETLRQARWFEFNLQKLWYPVKERCARAITHRLIDAWGHQMDMDCELKAGGLVLRSAGPDGVFFSSDDVQWIGNPRSIVDDG